MRFNRLVITTAAAFVLALGATAAATAAGNATGSSPTVRPNPDEQILTTATKPTDASRPATRTVQPNPDEQALTATNTSHGPIAGTPAVIVRASSAKSGFHWGDAGIGAAGALGASLIALASWIAVSQRRARRTGSAAATH
jgi:hypothetical protein